jgi:hypothetical protein
MRLSRAAKRRVDGDGRIVAPARAHRRDRIRLASNPRLRALDALRVGDSEASSGEVVSMMQTAEPRHGNHLRTDRRSPRGLPAGWSFLVQTEMSSVVMMIGNVLVHQAFQMALVKHNHVVKQITTASRVFARDSYKIDYSGVVQKSRCVAVSGLIA